MKYGESNARSEVMNKSIQNLRQAAHGYRNIERLKAMIVLRYGKLDWGYSHQERRRALDKQCISRYREIYACFAGKGCSFFQQLIT